MSRPRRFVLLVLLAVVTLLAPAARAKKPGKPPPPPCAPGRFVVAEAALLPGDDVATPDGVVLESGTGGTIVQVESGCGFAAATLAAKKKFTLLKARWPRCATAGGGTMKLAAKIAAPDCHSLSGVLKAKVLKKARRFTAERTLQQPACRPSAPRDPGRPTLHRLNSAEYDATMRDLIGDTSAPGITFPADDVGHGFDNIGDVLSVAPLLFEKYEVAAEKVAADALPTPTPPNTTRFEAETDATTKTTGGGFPPYWNLWSNGSLTAPFFAPAGGDYDLTALAFQAPAPPDPARMTFLVDNAPVITVDVTALDDAPVVYTARVHFPTAGAHRFGVQFENDLFEDPYDRNLNVDWIEVAGPYDPPPPANPGGRAKVVICDPAAVGRRPCTAAIAAAFGRRAWRRPLAADEVERLVQIADLVETEGDSFEAGVALVVQAILLSPHFVYRVETDPEPTSPSAHPLAAHELATRLSYLLWSTLPDAELAALADAGTLDDPEVLRTQVHRMLQDAKAEGFVENFAGQWLQTRALGDVNPDYGLFPTWGPDLREAMREETHLFFADFMRGDRPMLDMLDADFTFANDRLAAHYGLAPVGGAAPARVPLPAGQRGGLLTQGSFLVTTSHFTRTSPVKRGNAVLKQLLCQPPPPPLPGVNVLAEPVDPNATLRERMEQHRSRPECQSCHVVMDAIGFGLENYDAVGAWRTLDTTGRPIDPSGELPGARHFAGHEELGRLLKNDPATARCMTERLMTYALGRGLEEADGCVVNETTNAFLGAGGRVADLVTAIVQSPAFRTRRGDPAGGTP